MQETRKNNEKMDAKGQKINAEIEEMNEKMDARDERMNEKMEMMDVKINKQISVTEKFQKDVEANKNEITEIKEGVKDMKTNLQITQDVVAENVILIDQKVKSRASFKK